jgi:hypothetical protein
MKIITVHSTGGAGTLLVLVAIVSGTLVSEGVLVSAVLIIPSSFEGMGDELAAAVPLYYHTCFRTTLILNSEMSRREDPGKTLQTSQ